MLDQSEFERQMQIFEAIKDTDVLPELKTEPSLEFIVSTPEEVLYPIIENNDILVVAGAYFGDEAKGKTTDAIARHPAVSLVARYNSGENAGHTVYLDGTKYVFHLTPSGILIPGKLNAIGHECVMDPVSFVQKEISQLVRNGIDYKDRLLVGNVHIVGPYHKILDFVANPDNSSTLKGISPVHASKVWKKGLRLDNLFNSEDTQVKRLNRDLSLYHGLLTQLGLSEEEIFERFEKLREDKKDIPEHLTDFLKAKDKTEFLLDLYRRTVVLNPDFPKRADVSHVSRQILAKGGKVLAECPQSYWLSNATEKHWCSSTSPQTHAAGVLASSLANIFRYRVVVVNVAKTPADSRVGRGANPSSFVSQTYFSDKGINSLKDLGNACLDYDKITKEYYDSVQPNGVLKPTLWHDPTGTYTLSEAIAISSSRENGEFGATTGKPRVTGLFDCVAGFQVNEAQGPYLSVSALDRGDKLEKVGLTIAYVFHNPTGEAKESNGVTYRNGDIIRIGDQYPCDEVLSHCHPIIKVMDGWKNTPIAADKRRLDTPLPKNVQRFVSAISEFTGFNVISIGNGKETENMIYLKPR